MKISEILKETQQDVYVNLERLKRKAAAEQKQTTKADHHEKINLRK